MRKNVARDRLIIIGTLTLLTGFFWISLEVYRSLITDKITPEFKSEVTPLNPRLDIQTLDQIVSKRSLDVDLQKPLASQTNTQLTAISSPPNVPLSSDDLSPTPSPTDETNPDAGIDEIISSSPDEIIN